MSKYFKIVETYSNAYELQLKSGVSFGSLKDIQLVERAIEKWQTIADYLHKHPDREVNDRGTETCPLCAKYFGPCTGCPIYNYTNYSHCDSSPYEDYCLNKTEEYALEEVEFLQCVLRDEQEREEE